MKKLWKMFLCYLSGRCGTSYSILEPDVYECLHCKRLYAKKQIFSERGPLN